MNSRNSRKQKGGISPVVADEIMAKTDGDMNRFYNYYLEKALDSTPSVKANAQLIPSGPGVTNSILVIDMQNDFTKPHPDGAFSVAGGDTMVAPLVEWINTNAANCTKVVFSRDSHDGNHCSFAGARNGPFPPHCIIDTPGAEMYAAMMPFAKLPNAAVIFKGMSPDVDSFGALQYPDDEYSVGRQIGAECCSASKGSKSLGACADATGGFKFPLTTEEAFGPRPFAAVPNWNSEKTKFNVADIFQGGETEHNVFVVGLAGDYCVRDTAINIGKLGEVNGVKVNVFVVQPLTRYAFVPLPVGYPVTVATLAAGKNANGKRKPLPQYAFKLGASGFEIISAADAAKLTNSNISFTSPYFHFLTDPRDIIDNYSSAGVKVLMDMPTLKAESGNSGSGNSGSGNSSSGNSGSAISGASRSSRPRKTLANRPPWRGGRRSTRRSKRRHMSRRR